MTAPGVRESSVQAAGERCVPPLLSGASVSAVPRSPYVTSSSTGQTLRLRKALLSASPSTSLKSMAPK